MTKLNDKIKIVDLGLVVHNTLVISDIHLGYEESLAGSGVLLPKTQVKDILNHLKKIFNEVKVEQVIINGDFKHDFGGIKEGEWRDSLKIIDYILMYSKKIIFVKGNHDMFLGPIAKKRDIEIVDYYKIDDVLICHGDKIIQEESNTIVIGHEHPAIGVQEGARVEKFKCFLVGKLCSVSSKQRQNTVHNKQQTIIVMPSFNTVTEGTDVLRNKLISPYLDDVSEFDCYIVADKVYSRSKVKDWI